MSFGGSVAAMVQSLKNNKSQLSRRDKYFDKKVLGEHGIYKKFVDHKKMSPSEFKAFQQQLKRNEALRKRKVLFIFGVVMVIIISVLAYFLYY